MTAEQPPLDIDRLLETLNRHQVDFLLVGGVAAIAHGAIRPTSDLDCLARRTGDNLARLAAAMRELNARLRVHGLTDTEAAALPTPLDADSLGRMEISTWRTDAGDFDVLTDIPGGDGHRLRYDELIGRSAVQELHGVAVRVAALEDVIASKEWADRPKDRQALPELRELAARRDDTPDVDREIARMLEPLDSREREILRLRFGLDRGEPRSLEEVAAHFNLSRERIREIEASALSKLKHPPAG